MPLLLSTAFTLEYVIMAKVKPYLITVKFIGVYEDPRPTISQVTNELNIDALEVTIEDAIVMPASKVADAKPVAVDPYEAPPAPAATKVDRIKRNLLPFDTTDLDSNGPSVKILAALFEKARTQRELRDLTKLNTPTVATTLSRLKKKGRVTVSSTHPTDGAVYAFVK